MQVLVDIDRAEADGVIDPAQAAELRRRARRDAIGLGVGMLLTGGVLAVLAGLFALVPSPAGLTVLGVAALAGGVGALLWLDERLALPANAAVVIGTAAALGGLLWRWIESGGSPVVSVWTGLAAAALGVDLYRRRGGRLATAGAWIAVLGAAAHLVALALLRPEAAQAQSLWAAVLLLLLGAGLDLRLLSALAPVALAGMLSRTGYHGGGYWLVIEEPTLLVALMGGVALAAAVAAPRLAERDARHARIAGLLAFVWMNLGLWVGSIWGDRVGARLWQPSPDDFATAEAWHAAVDAHAEAAPAIPDWAFALGWAALILAVGAWAALGGRRSVLNAAASFGAIHLYTQWFTRLETTPESFVAAGLVAIGLAWGLAWANARVGRQGGRG